MSEEACRRRRRRSLVLDVAMAAGFTLLDTASTLLGLSWWPERPGTLAWVLLGVQAAACLSLLARRRAPLTVLAVLGVFTLAVTLLISPGGVLVPAGPENVWAPFATIAAAYGPLYYRRDRRLAFAALGAYTLVIARVWDPSVGVLTDAVLRTAVGPLLALYFDGRRRVVRMLTERAERAERERGLLAERARAEERARLAGEMHDVVTHRVSLMVLQAGALRVTAADEQVRQAAEELRAAGCQVLDELRDLIGILGAAPEPDAPPSAADFAALVAESASVGTPAELVEEGDRALASPVVGRTAYRIVREALTNVRKHAPGARVDVRIEYGQAQVRLTVRNTPPTGLPDGPLTGTGSGLGIAGLRRRVEVVHGTLRAGPSPDGGFRVEATLPSYVPT
ncbi:histidine kinase [Nonomuraea spiralis]|uniref:histidine kinase n=1 Tax=Nonomuraea spiralis TaxID=46182 RepID=A0ABV5IEL3_9ACTN|nr:sensor histidine kinase [Nonomuraea spiralis]